MFLAVDIGNTNTTLGFFDGDNLVKKINISSSDYANHEKLLAEILNGKKISECIISSVVDELCKKTENIIKKYLNISPLIVDSKLNLGMKIKAEFPEKIGTDRVVNAYIAGKMYSKPAIVVDMGTATTFDIIDSNGDFIGGIIMPGIETQLKSLNKNTSKLPNLDYKEFKNDFKTINTETSKAILSGVIKGHAYAIEGLLKDCKKELKTKPLVILTGGFAELVSSCIENHQFDVINPDLTLYGLKMISNCRERNGNLR